MSPPLPRSAATATLLALVLATATLVACKPDELQENSASAVYIKDPSGPGFWLDRTPVTVGAYRVFARASGYTTEAERFGNAGVFDYDAKAWALVDGATYRLPFGPDAQPAREDHPATQVSYADASAYCRYYGKRLPSEREWERAARYKQPAGTVQYPWGDGIAGPDGSYRANVWQGIFPHAREVGDGFAYTSPVEAFPPAPSGLYDMAGNVWEWTTDTLANAAKPGEGTYHVAKGGSFLCEPRWCHGYLIDGATETSAETSLFHMGFRCACDNL